VVAALKIGRRVSIFAMALAAPGLLFLAAASYLTLERAVTS
jgi:hypothetical protein